MKKHALATIGLSIVIGITYVLLVNVICLPWMDEICGIDTAVNLVEKGTWHSTVWDYTYPFMYAINLVIWFSIFGVSHVSTCSFEIFFAFLSFCLLIKIIYERDIFNKAISYYLFTLLFWFGFYMPSLITMGRMDMMVMFFTVLLIDPIIPNGKKNECKNTVNLKLFIFAYLLSLTAIYPLPAVAFFAIFLFLVVYRADKKEMFQRGFFVAIGMISGIISTIMLFYVIGKLPEFLGTFIKFNSNLSEQNSFFIKLFVAYRDIPTTVLSLTGVIMALLTIKKKDDSIVLYSLFVLFIPFLMMISGRYERYYSWLAFVPSVMCLIYILERYDKMKFVPGLIILLLLTSLIVYHISFTPHLMEHRRDAWTADYKKTLRKPQLESHLANNYISSLSPEFEKYKNVVITDEIFYYPVKQKNGLEVWYFVGSFSYLSASDDCPNQGVYISTNAKDRKIFVDYINKRGFKYKELPQTQQEYSALAFWK